MGIFERYLSIWISLAIVLGLAFGSIFPKIFKLVASLEFYHVNLAIAVLIWLMIYPMMVQINFSSIKGIGKNSKGLILTGL